MSMFGSLVQRLTSPVTSPTSARRRCFKSSSRWEVQSEPEDELQAAAAPPRKSRAKHLLDKRKSKSRARGTDQQPPVWQDLSLAPLRATKSLGRLDGIKQVQRLAEYERYLGQEARNLATAESGNCLGSGPVIQRGQLEGDLHRIQQLFPNDNLRLHEQDVLTTKPKNVVRKRNSGGTNLGRLPKVNKVSGPKSAVRAFLLESPVQFTMGMQSQERHLFLFSDLVLIAKARSGGGSFKLKQSVRMSELWLTASHIEEVAEVHKSQETSFVLGWPTSNVVASFMTAAARDLWWSRLSELVREQSLKEPAETNIQVVYQESETGTEYCKKISVSPEMTAAACVNLATRLLELQGPFQLWARTCLEEAPYPLIGHERPFAVKLSNLRHKLSLEEGFDLEHCNKSGHDTCHFILRPILKSASGKKLSTPGNGLTSATSKSKIQGLLRRSLSLNPQLFGVSLSRLDENGLPKPVLAMLQQLFAKGPFTQGIFRKSANVRIVRELRDQVEASGDSTPLEDAPIIAVAALLKDFLRSLPDPLLTSHLFPLWLASLDSPDPMQAIKSILDRLPKANYTLLSHLICVLQHIARRSKHNLMCASNLAVCCGPSLLWSQNPSVNQSRAIPAVTEMLIRHCESLFGEGVVHLFGEERNDSGAEESTDSLHSGGLSLDSLDLTEPPRKDHMSLSRDSGLTLSDCQLFIPESPVGSEDSAVNSLTKHEKSSSSKTYVRAYNHQWEERYGSGNQLEQSYPNPNFQRQDWLRAQLKRTPRTRLDEQEHQVQQQQQQQQRDYHRQKAMKEQNPSKCLSEFKSEVCRMKRVRVCEVYGSREREGIYQFKQAETIEAYEQEAADQHEQRQAKDQQEQEEEEELQEKLQDRAWPETPPPLPPRLRHLPPVHMNLEDRHKIAGRSRSLPPPPPYRPPPQPRAALVTSRHLGYARSLLDDESYV